MKTKRSLDISVICHLLVFGVGTVKYVYETAKEEGKALFPHFFALSSMSGHHLIIFWG